MLDGGGRGVHTHACIDAREVSVRPPFGFHVVVGHATHEAEGGPPLFIRVGRRKADSSANLRQGSPRKESGQEGDFGDIHRCRSHLKVRVPASPRFEGLPAPLGRCCVTGGRGCAVLCHHGEGRLRERRPFKGGAKRIRGIGEVL